jgi:hypothetical protein
MIDVREVTKHHGSTHGSRRSRRTELRGPPRRGHDPPPDPLHRALGAVIIALFGTGLGLVLGIGFGWAIVQALDDAALTGQGIDIFTIPVGQLAVVAVVVGLAGVAAAILPAQARTTLIRHPSRPNGR